MVHCVGDSADMPAAYDWADIVLAPSLRPEPFGRTVVEAGAMAKPVIAADHGGAQETMIPGETGVLTAPGDAKALAVAITQLTEMKLQARRAMGARARDHVQGAYSADAMCAATLNAYRDVMTNAAVS